METLMPNWLANLLRILLTAALPICLVLTNVRLMLDGVVLFRSQRANEHGGTRKREPQKSLSHHQSPRCFAFRQRSQ